MSTLSEQNIDLSIPGQQKRRSAGHIVRRIGLTTLGILGALLALLMTVPVALLPFITAVPPAFSLLLALFEHSGHSPWVEESEKVVDVMVNTVLKQTAPWENRT